MSFPALLRTPGLSDRFAHLRIRPTEKAAPTASAARRNKRDDKEGKRWVRRKENGVFAHSTTPLSVCSTSESSHVRGQRTHRRPVPEGLRRPAPQQPRDLPPAAAHLPLAQHRRAPRPAHDDRARVRQRRPLLAQPQGHAPRAAQVRPAHGAARPRGRGRARRVAHAGRRARRPGRRGRAREPGGADRDVGDDQGGRALARPARVVHRRGRVYAVRRALLRALPRHRQLQYVSFPAPVPHRADARPTGKDTSGQRVTYLLRPNSTRPSRHTAAPPPGPLDTPPLTDLSEFSDLSAHELDTDPEPPSDRDLSDAEGARAHPRALAAIVELASAPPSPVMYARAALDEDDGWSVLGGSDIDGDGEPEAELEDGIAALALASSDGEADVDMAAGDLGERVVRRRQGPGPEALRSRLLDRQRRAASSPSRSPARRVPRRARARAEAVRVVEGGSAGRRSFYDYLFA